MNPASINPFEISCDKDAATKSSILSKRLEIGTLVQAESMTRLHLSIGKLQGVAISMEMGYESGFSFDESKKLFTCVVKIHCKGQTDTAIDESTPKGTDAFSVMANYALETVLGQDFESAEERQKHLGPFSAINAPMMVWPMWREFLQRSTSHMGLAPVTAPFLRVDVKQDPPPSPAPE